MRSSLAIGILTVAVFGLITASNTASAGSHSWRVNEVFSNADGTVQFVELKECCGAGSEFGLTAHPLISHGAGTQFNFPANLTSNTANKHLLLATSAFAALPGAPTPDYIIPANFILVANPGLIEYDFWDLTMTIPAGMLPTDGVTSVIDAAGSPGFTTGTNSPTNFAGATGTVDAGGGTPAPSVGFMLSTNSVSEAAPSHSFLVLLTNTGGPLSGPITVTIEDAGTGTATAGADYVAPGVATVVIPASASNGEGVPMTLTLMDDLVVEGPETIELEITMTSGASSIIGTNSTYTITLLDDDVPPAGGFQRADVNQDGTFNIADPVRLLAALFSGQPVTCDQSMDVNDDESVNIADAIAALGNLFSGAPAPGAPFGACGVDPTPGGVTCVLHNQCP